MTPRAFAPAAAVRVAAALLLWLTPAVVRAGDPPSEPSEYRRDAYRAPTPATLAGAHVLSTAEAAALWKAGGAAFVDVMPRPPRPANLPAGTVWHEVPRQSIPGAVWLANVGFGSLNPDAEAYFRTGLAAVTRDDPAAPLVLFCQRDCWMSWNAAKRAISYGYRNVSWFPEGTDGWGEAGLPLAPLEPRP